MTSSHKIPVSYAVQEESTSPRFARAFALGCGGIATPADRLLPGPVALFGSPKRVQLLEQAKTEGRNWYYGDHGFYRRGKYYRITKNAYQYVPTREAIDEAEPHRLRACHVDVQPAWQSSGTSIIICPNSPTYMAWFGVDAHQWVLDLVGTLGKLTDRPIVVRWKTQAQRRPLYLDLHDAWMTVVFSSNAAVESLAYGVPICVLAPWATTAQMGIQDIQQVESPVRPDHREKFLWHLAERQWNMVEIEAGLAWKQIQ